MYRSIVITDSANAAILLGAMTLCLTNLKKARSSCLSVSNAEKVCFNSASASTGRRDRR
jgi:hypothetical protein